MASSLSPFHYDALVINSTVSDERPAVIKGIGQKVFNTYGTTSSLRDLMNACIEQRPDLAPQLLGQFNGALDDIGSWRC